MTTKTRLVANYLIAKDRGTIVFNDLMKDGRRSLKVWGWTRDDYEEARQRLIDLGCRVELVEFQTHPGGRGCQRVRQQIRLYVAE